MRRVFTFLVALAFLALTALAWADVPTEMSVQGRLTNGAGAPVPAGLKNFTFKIWDAPAGGTEIWPAGPGETQLLSTDANGLWNAGVGQIIPLTEAVFLNPVRWLEVTVDDGVNPIETLPRIELRTNPYTYRAATSQQADSLAGNSFADLGDLFVNEAADTMSGQLRIDWNHTGSGGANLEVSNTNAPYSPGFWAVNTGTWGTASETFSDDPIWNIGNASVALGASTQNVGMYGYATGTGSLNFGVYGVTSGGNQNYAGYFSGDLLVTGAGVGDSTVILPPSAISSSEIFNEPGIAFSAAFPSTNLAFSNTATDFVTVSITIPSSGYVVVRGTATILFSNTTLANYAWMQIDQTAGGTFGTRWVWVGAGNHASTNNDYGTGSISKVYSLGAGTHTFRLEGNGWSLNNVSASTVLFQTELLATFYPTSYGTVSTLVAERGDFEDASAVRVSDPQGGVEVGVYEVDLRELELKAARAQAESEKAHREYVEARLSSASTVVTSTAQEKK